MLFRYGSSLEAQIRSTAAFRAFTFIELLILIGILVLVACVLLPSLAYQKRHSRQRTCVNNLKRVGVAFRTWNFDGDFHPPKIDVKFGGAREQVELGHVFFNFLVMSNQLSTSKILVCPADDGKTVAANFTANFNNANVSYFVGADAMDTFPYMFLSGDRNLAFESKPLQPGIFVWTSNRSALSWTTTIHNCRGNVGLADGSVQFFDSKQLAAAARNQSCETSRLAIP
jgi:type II secretory pathway pseudopilin PulG